MSESPYPTIQEAAERHAITRLVSPKAINELRDYLMDAINLWRVSKK